MELQSLNSIACLLHDRCCVRKAQRPHGRDPAEPNAGRNTQLVQGHIFIGTKSAARIGEAKQTKCFVVTRSRKRRDELGIEHQFFGTARIKSHRVCAGSRRSQCVSFETPNTAQTADIVVFEQWEGLAIEPLAPTHICVERKCVFFG